MVEYVREVKITVCVDTNKQTHKEEFDDIDKAHRFYEGIMENIDKNDYKRKKINKKYVQAKNPKLEKWVKVDITTGLIVDTKKDGKPYSGIKYIDDYLKEIREDKIKK